MWARGGKLDNQDELDKTETLFSYATQQVDTGEFVLLMVWSCGGEALDGGDDGQDEYPLRMRHSAGQHQ